MHLSHSYLLRTSSDTGQGSGALMEYGPCLHGVYWFVERYYLSQYSHTCNMASIIGVMEGRPTGLWEYLNGTFDWVRLPWGSMRSNLLNRWRERERERGLQVERIACAKPLWQERIQWREGPWRWLKWQELKGQWRERVDFKGGGGRGLDPAGCMSCLIKSYLPSSIIKPISPSGAKFMQTYRTIK